MIDPKTGIEYSDDGRTLIKCPREFEGHLTIPNGIIRIGYESIYGCQNLTGITIPDSVTYIEYTFLFCPSLTNITVSKNNEAYCSINDVLYNKEKTTLVACPEGITGSFEIPFGVVRIGSRSSQGCCAFQGCANLTGIIIPDSVTTIGKYVFEDCVSLTDIAIPDSVTSIEGEGLFCGCRSLTSVILPNSLTRIYSDMFKYCCSLISITIPDGVTTIDKGAFEDCNKENLIFHVQKGSYADTWAKKNGYKVKYDINPPTNPPSDSLASTSFFS